MEPNLSSSQPPLHIDVLRGIHTSDTKHEVVHMLQPADLILLENVGLVSSKRQWRDGYNLITHTQANKIDPEYSKQFEKHIQGQIVLELAGTGKQIENIDVSYTQEEFDTGTSVKYLLFNDIAALLIHISKNPLSRFEVTNRFIAQHAGMISARDDLVVQQVDHYLNQSHKDFITQKTAKNSVCTVALVQGYFHRVTQRLKDLFPAASVTEIVYGQQLIDNMMKDDFNFYVIDKKTQDSTYTFTDMEIDYFLLHYITAIEYQLNESAPGHEKSKQNDRYANNIELMAVGLSHASYKGQKRKTSQIPPLGTWNQAGLSGHVEAKLREMQTW